MEKIKKLKDEAEKRSRQLLNEKQQLVAQAWEALDPKFKE